MRHLWRARQGRGGDRLSTDNQEPFEAHVLDDTTEGAKLREALARDISGRGDPFTANCVRRLLDAAALAIYGGSARAGMKLVAS